MRILCKLYNSFIWSCAGFKYALTDLSFKLEALLALILIPLSFWVATTKVELILLILSIFIILITELLNTAIETVVDRIGLENHALSKYAKDLGSAAVFCALLLAGIIWAICIF